MNGGVGGVGVFWHSLRLDQEPLRVIICRKSVFTGLWMYSRSQCAKVWDIQMLIGMCEAENVTVIWWLIACSTSILMIRRSRKEKSGKSLHFVTFIHTHQLWFCVDSGGHSGQKLNWSETPSPGFRLRITCFQMLQLSPLVDCVI